MTEETPLEEAKRLIAEASFKLHEASALILEIDASPQVELFTALKRLRVEELETVNKKLNILLDIYSLFFGGDE